MNIASSLAATGDNETAVSVLRQILGQSPGNLVVMRNLGIVLANMGNADEALSLLIDVAQRQCTLDNVMPLLGLLRLLRRIPDMDGVAAGAWPHMGDQPAFLGEWGYACLMMEKYDQAVDLFRRALAVDPAFRPAMHNLSAALIRQQKGEEAVRVFSGLAQPWEGSVQARDLVTEYAALSSDYDDMQLHRYFSRRLLELHDRVCPVEIPGTILDLGCGSGQLVAALSWPGVTVTGIDLSPHMLSLAEQRGRYAALHCGEMVEVMASLAAGAFDRVFSAGVLCYLPRLDRVFEMVARLLSQGGVFVFSVDPAIDGMDIGEVIPGEYCHSRRYLRQLAAAVGMVEQAIEIDVHRGPPGFWCAFRKA